MAIYGREWVKPTASKLNVDVRTVQRWAAGEHGIPPGVFAELLPDARQAAKRLRDELSALDRTIETLSA